MQNRVVELERTPVTYIVKSLDLPSDELMNAFAEYDYDHLLKHKHYSIAEEAMGPCITNNVLNADSVWTRRPRQSNSM